MVNRLGFLEVNYDLLLKALELPTDTIIHEVRPSNYRRVATLLVSHPILPEVPDGAEIPRLKFVAQRVDGTFEIGENGR